jgi:hypothetical protein
LTVPYDLNKVGIEVVVEMMSGKMDEKNVKVKYWLLGVLKNDINNKITPKNREILQVYYIKLLANKENSGKSYHR